MFRCDRHGEIALPRPGEIGEPARKSLIVDLAPDDRRARTVGLYYAIRNGLVVPAGVIGGVLFGADDAFPGRSGETIDVAYKLSENEWNGASIMELKIIDTRLAADRQN